MTISHPPVSLSGMCGGSYPVAVDVAMTASRLLWTSCMEEDALESGGRSLYRVLDFERTYAALAARLTECAAEWEKGALDIHPSVEQLPALASYVLRNISPDGTAVSDGKLRVPLSTLHPFALVRLFLAPARPDPDLRYHVYRNMQMTYRASLSPEIARIFHLLADSVNELRRDTLSSPGALFVSPGDAPGKWKYAPEFLRRLCDVLNVGDLIAPVQRGDLERSREGDAPPPDPAYRTIHMAELFVECCRSVAYLQPHYEPGYISLKTQSVDAEYLLSHLFGLPTSIHALDDLLGGGGLMLPEAAGDSSSEMPGRIVVVTGQFGTGKSILSLQLAIEVARKGGIAWVMPLEQSATEYLYSLHTLCKLPSDGSVFIARTAVDVEYITSHRKSGIGALIIYRNTKETYADFLTTFVRSAEKTKNYPLRLLVADPINSIRDLSRGTQEELRALTLEMVDEVKKAGTNILFVVEENNDRVNELDFEKNVADTVFRLFIDRRHRYAQRYLEITKSRLQREQRGSHAFAINPGTGIHIFPSSAAVSARLRGRSLPRTRAVRFGHQAMDRILGAQGLVSGDVIVLQGPRGSFKTMLGVVFVSGRDRMRGTTSLVVTAGDGETTIRHLLDEERSRRIRLGESHEKPIQFCRLPRGHVNPGYVLQSIEDALRAARAARRPIDRVLFDNVVHWELGCPFISEDETFGDALIELLKAYDTTSLLICEDFWGVTGSILQRSIVDSANCLIRFDQHSRNGGNQVSATVVKTRGMTHAHESFAVTLNRDGLHLYPRTCIQLLFHAETSQQREYNEVCRMSLSEVVPPETTVELCEDLSYTRSGWRYQESLGELRLVQADEFQLPDRRAQARAGYFHTFPFSLLEQDDWPDFLPRLSKRCETGADGFYAVPYYDNLSFLVYRKDGAAVGCLDSWTSLSESCVAWEADNPEPSAVFFEFPRVTAENYNSLFLEILMSLLGSIDAGQYDLRTVLNSKQAAKAATLFRCLGRRAYLREKQSRAASSRDEPKWRPISSSGEAQVFRHWYSTFNQMLAEDPSDLRRQIAVAPLPGHITTAGEWYLTVPSSSGSPELALQLVRELTSRKAEVDRLRRGVGLPTRRSLYTESAAGLFGTNPPSVSLDPDWLRNLGERAFRRSDFAGYSRVGAILAPDLIRILELSDIGEDLDASVSRILQELGARLEFLGGLAGGPFGKGAADS